MSNIGLEELKSIGAAVHATQLVELSKMVSSGKLSESAAKEVYKTMRRNHKEAMRLVTNTYKEASRA